MAWSFLYSLPFPALAWCNACGCTACGGENKALLYFMGIIHAQMQYPCGKGICSQKSRIYATYKLCRPLNILDSNTRKMHHISPYSCFYIKKKINLIISKCWLQFTSQRFHNNPSEFPLTSMLLSVSNWYLRLNWDYLSQSNSIKMRTIPEPKKDKIIKVMWIYCNGTAPCNSYLCP